MSQSYGDQPYVSPAAAGPGKMYFGDHIGRAMNFYMAQWRDWLAPIAVCAAISIASYLCFVLPFLLVQGPLSCGLYACALKSLRGGRVDTSDLRRGQELLGVSMLASLANLAVLVAPMVLLMCIVFSMPMMLIGLAPPGNQGSQGAQGAFVVLGMFAWMAIYLAGLGLLMIWQLWIGTRTMFVMPLIADQGLDFRTAFRLSWESTRHGFWDLLLLKFIAGLIGMMGVYACYIGLIFTVPLHFLIVAAAYEQRFGQSRSPFALPPAPPLPRPQYVPSPGVAPPPPV